MKRGDSGGMAECDSACASWRWRRAVVKERVWRVVQRGQRQGKVVRVLGGMMVVYGLGVPCQVMQR